MKKNLIIFFISIFVLVILWGCTDNNRLKLGEYTINENTAGLGPYLTLEDNNKFILYQNSLLSYHNYGSYIVENGKLVLDDEFSGGEFIFEVKGSQLIFKSGTDLIESGTVFSLSLDE